MRHTARIGLSLTLIALLAACSSEKGKEGVGKQAVQMLKSRFGKGDAPQPPTRDQLRAAITPELREQQGNVPLLLVTSLRTPVSSILTRFAVNGATETYLTPDQISFAMRDGLVVATRGLGNDLMNANVTGVLARIQEGTGEALRDHRYLDGENQEVRESFRCRYSRAEHEVIERCQGAELSFTNRYALSEDGRIAISTQWVSPGLQSFLIEDIR